MTAGLHLTWLPLSCAPDPEPTDATCDTPLGEPCRPSECGGGECVDRFNFPWSQGACLVNQSSGCVREDGALLRGGPGGPYFARACDGDQDCDRDAPYRRDPLQGACVPYNVPRVALGAISFPPFCGR